MSVNIGIFDKESDVVEAIRLLREAGMDHDEMRVIVKNVEAAPLIAATTDVSVEELAGMQAYRDSQTGLGGVWPVVAAVPVSNLGSGTTPGMPGMAAGAAGVLGADLTDGDNTNDRLLRDVGIPDHASDRCGEEVEAGRFLLCTEADDDTNAVDILRHAGASEVLH